MKLRYLILIGIIIVGTYAIYRYARGTKNKYVFGTAQKQDITEVVSEAGNVISNGQVEMYSSTNGVIGSMYVSNGDLVKENQKLFTVKSTSSSQEKSDAYALYQAAKNSLQQAENVRRGTIATVDRVHDDVKNHDKDETYLQREARTIAEVANDNAYSALLTAKAQLVSAQVKYFSTQNSTITAPIKGVVSSLTAVQGSHVEIESPLTPSLPVLLISQTGTTEIVIPVGESQINKIKKDQSVSLKFDAVEGQIYKGVIDRFDENGILTQGVAKYNVYITVLDGDEKLKPGMSVDADIITNEVKDVLSVPNTAIKPYQKGRAVRILGDNGKIEYLPVKTGIKGIDFTQILEGLKEGQQIILSESGKSTESSNFFQI